MAGLPDVLTDDQMEKLGGKALPNEMTDEEMNAATKPAVTNGLDPSLYEAADKLDRIGQAARDYRKNVGEINFLRSPEAMHGRPLSAGDPVEPPLMREDPAMDVATTLAGAGAGKVVGKGVAKLSPVLARLAEPAVAGAVTSKLQGGSLKQAGIAGGIGAAMGVPGAAMELIRGAPAAVAERLPTAVTGGAKSKAAKQVVAGAPITDMLDSHPELKKVLATGDLTEKFNATGSTLNKLTSANDAVYDAIQAQHQGIPFEPVADKLRGVAAAAHKAGDDTLEGAANAAIENLQRFTDVADKRGGIVSATQLRGVRNNLARRVQAINPTLGASDVQAAADEIKRAINEGIEDIAGQTKGVDVKALKERNQQIAQLLPVQRSLRAQVIDKKLLGPEDKLADLIEHPQHEIAGLVRKLPAHADVALAGSPGLQSFAAGARSPLPELATRSLMAGSSAALARPPRRDDLEYAAKVSQGMQNGMSLQEAIDNAR